MIRARSGDRSVGSSQHPTEGDDMLRRTLPFATVAAATALLAPAALAAPATTGTMLFSYTGSDSSLVDDCTGASGGVLTGTGAVTIRFTQMNGGEVDHGLDSGVVRIDFSDGSHFVGDYTDHFSVVGPPSGIFVFTDAHADGGVLYAADGSIRAREVIRATEHTTITRDGQARVSFERGRLTCS